MPEGLPPHHVDILNHPAAQDALAALRAAGWAVVSNERNDPYRSGDPGTRVVLGKGGRTVRLSLADARVVNVHPEWYSGARTMGWITWARLPGAVAWAEGDAMGSRPVRTTPTPPPPTASTAGKEKSMSIIEAARQAYAQRKEREEQDRADALILAVERLLGTHAPARETLVAQQNVLYTPGPFEPASPDEDHATGWTVTVQGMEFALHGKRLFVNRWDAADEHFVWSEVRDFHELGAWQYEMPGSITPAPPSGSQTVVLHDDAGVPVGVAQIERHVIRVDPDGNAITPVPVTVQLDAGSVDLTFTHPVAGWQRARVNIEWSAEDGALRLSVWDGPGNEGNDPRLQTIVALDMEDRPDA